MRDLAGSSASSSSSASGSGRRKRTSSDNDNNINSSVPEQQQLPSSKRQRRSLRSSSSSSSSSNTAVSEDIEELHQVTDIVCSDSSNGDYIQSGICGSEMIVEQQHNHQEVADTAPAFVECLRRIVSSDEQSKVEEAWNSLEEMENLESGSKNSTYDCNRSYDKILRSILIEDKIRNIAEIPKLLEWFSKFPFPHTTANNPVSNDIARFLINSASDFKHQPYLAEIIQVLNDNHEKYLPPLCDYSSLWQAIIEVLSWIQVPEDAVEMKKYSKDLITISDFLKKRRIFDVMNASMMCFNKFCEIFFKSERMENPSAALLVALQLVDEKLWRDHMCVVVEHLIKENIKEPKIIKMLNLFCQWLVQPPYTNMNYLSRWLTLFMKSWTKYQKRRIVTEVADEMLPLIFLKCMRSQQFYTLIPEENIIFFLLSLVSSQELFHKMMKLFIHLMEDERISTYPNERAVRGSIIQIISVLLGTFSAHRQNAASCKICETVEKLCCAYLCKGMAAQQVTEEKEEMEISYPSTSSGVGRIDPGKTGLRNLGNTCYMNSVLQALAMTRAFTHEVLLYKSTNLSNQMILKHLQNLFALLKYSEKASLAPTEIWRSSKPSYFMPGQQQDSSEFLCHLLDVLYEQEKSALVNVSVNDQSISEKSTVEKEIMDVEEEAAETLESPLNDNGTSKTITRWTTEGNLSEGEELAQTQNGLSDSHSDSTDSGIQSVGGEDTITASPYLVHRVFGGELKVTYQCMQCGTESHNTDQFRDLQLCFLDTLAPTNPITVQDLINSNYSMPEHLTGDNKYRCDSCATLCNAQRIIKILQAPAHLILTLKHFRYDSESRLRTKLRRKVIYNETIQLPVLDQDNETYQLYAAVVHSGYSMDYGHYITYACDAKNRWYKFNDNFVSQVGFENFMLLEPPDTPYILFYRRCGRQNEPDEDAPDFASLGKNLQDYVEQEKRCQTEERRITRLSAAGNSIARYNQNGYWNKDDDEDNPPPSKCRDAVNIPSGKFLC
ncbi:ubiquitin carboxyl-terminal hydrolase 35 [Copidosoma floridanum]|uniref:ubiquitin carboxyl-terminal hydrolase 35 n=1 Tax=Copidosoma floridanum TaxID=29053 RepID=UPI0006C941E5|nr:ubiquitin carboxyl-terminal hydrolase 35 [Copidosoma floridanum]